LVKKRFKIELKINILLKKSINKSVGCVLNNLVLIKIFLVKIEIDFKIHIRNLKNKNYKSM